MYIRTLLLACTLYISTSAQSAAYMEMKNAYSFETLAGTSTGAAYVTIINHGQTDMLITSASSPIAHIVELHDHQKTDEGVMQMVHLPNVSVGAGESVTFAPTGLHLMLMGIKTPLKEGDIIPLELTLSDGRTLSFNATVKAR